MASNCFAMKEYEDKTKASTAVRKGEKKIVGGTWMHGFRSFNSVTQPNASGKDHYLLLINVDR